MTYRVARKSCFVHGPAVRWKERLIEPSCGYVICGECHADGRYVRADFTWHRTKLMYSEGVWMSVMPTDDELIVALDFEGQGEVI